MINMIVIIYFIISTIALIIGYNYVCIQYKKRDNIFKHYSFSGWITLRLYDLILTLLFLFWPVFIIVGILYYPFMGIVYIMCYIGKAFRKIHKIE